MKIAWQPCQGFPDAFSCLYRFYRLFPASSPLLTKYKNNGHTTLTWGRYRKDYV
jgi:hypothetical protein